jgi:hypothetical protein
VPEIKEALLYYWKKMDNNFYVKAGGKTRVIRNTLFEK